MSADINKAESAGFERGCSESRGFTDINQDPGHPPESESRPGEAEAEFTHERLPLELKQAVILLLNIASRLDHGQAWEWDQLRRGLERKWR